MSRELLLNNRLFLLDKRFIMEAWRIALTVVLCIICVALTIIILFQEGKSAGLGSLAGQNTDSYWTKNKSRSKEGRMVLITSLLVVAFFVICAILNIGGLQ